MNVAALIAVVIPAVVGIIVVGVVLSNQDNTNFEQLREQARASVTDARTAEENDDEKTACAFWSIALKDLRRALTEFTQDRELIDLAIEAQNKLYRCDRVIPVDAQKLREFEGSDLRGPILAPDGLTLYTLDRGNDIIYQDELRYSGAVTNPSLEIGENPIIYRTMNIYGQYRVTELVDIEWITDGGAARNNALIALDENGLLISYAGGRAEALQLVVPETWNDPIAIAVYNGRFYVLDRGANQIWRFERQNGFYTAIGGGYFSNIRPDLSKAVDFAIDQRGAIYVLMSDGVIQKYFSDAPDSFQNDNLPVDGLQDTRAIFAANDPTVYALFVVDRSNTALYRFMQGGGVEAGYRPRDEELFKNVNGVYTNVENGVNNIFVLSGNALYYFPVE
jgi:hypothetical protein